MKPTILTPAMDGTRGIDCDEAITADLAARFYGHGYSFAIRYVRRSVAHPYDLTRAEFEAIIDAGLGLMLVQHVESAKSWAPSGSKGDAYAGAAVTNARALRYPDGAMLWCDLEGVAEGTPPNDVLAYLHGWYDVVKTAGYLPGLYVGFHCGLRPEALYHELAFEHYWASYNLDTDEYPAVRGIQMRQWSKHDADIPRGVTQAFQVDTVLADKLGGRPLLLVADNEEVAG
ncbi:MAG TPA: glycoside hydrolase domain-containing protein [Gemmatimonadaceae bacterium]|nr:glycoside hydrolase domain-containing protein [Gemmatimonadaceae bacterium]